MEDVLSAILEKYITKAFELMFSWATEAETKQLGIDLFMEASRDASKDKVTSFEVQMILVDKPWLIHINKDDLTLFDSMLGGLITMMKSIQPVE